eukprot:52277-Eustigmatos_ZCMA.PRE.1
MEKGSMSVMLTKELSLLLFTLNRSSELILNTSGSSPSECSVASDPSFVVAFVFSDSTAGSAVMSALVRFGHVGLSGLTAM